MSLSASLVTTLIDDEIGTPIVEPECNENPSPVEYHANHFERHRPATQRLLGSPAGSPERDRPPTHFVRPVGPPAENPERDRPRDHCKDGGGKRQKQRPSENERLVNNAFSVQEPPSSACTNVPRRSTRTNVHFKPFQKTNEVKHVQIHFCQPFREIIEP